MLSINRKGASEKKVILLLFLILLSISLLNKHELKNQNESEKIEFLQKYICKREIFFQSFSVQVGMHFSIDIFQIGFKNKNIYIKTTSWNFELVKNLFQIIGINTKKLNFK